MAENADHKNVIHLGRAEGHRDAQPLGLHDKLIHLCNYSLRDGMSSGDVAWAFMTAALRVSVHAVGTDKAAEIWRDVATALEGASDDEAAQTVLHESIWE